MIAKNLSISSLEFEVSICIYFQYGGVGSEFPASCRVQIEAPTISRNFRRLWNRRKEECPGMPLWFIEFTMVFSMSFRGIALDEQQALLSHGTVSSYYSEHQFMLPGFSTFWTPKDSNHTLTTAPRSCCCFHGLLPSPLFGTL